MDIYLPIAGLSVNALVIVGLGGLVGLLTGMVEGMLPMIQNDAQEVDLTEGTFNKGLNNVVKDNDMNFPPEWRLSRSGRAKP